MSVYIDKLVTQFLTEYFANGGIPTISTRVAYASGGTNAITDAAVSLTGISGIDSAELLQAQLMWLTVSTNTIRFWLDGSTPTAGGSGHTWSDTKGILVVQGATNIRNFRLVRNGVTDATVQVTLFR